MHVNEDDLVLHYYGELAPGDETRVAAHVRDCRECHAAFRRLQQVLTSIDESALAPPDLPDGFERVVWARLQPELQRTLRNLSDTTSSHPVSDAAQCTKFTVH